MNITRTFESTAEYLLAKAHHAAFGKPPTGPWLRAIAMRAGTRGPVATLADAGAAAGVTRERMRQVMKKLAPHLEGGIDPRAVDLARELVAHSPVPEPIGAQFDAAGLTRSTLTGEGFLNFLNLAGVSPTDLVGTDLVCVDGWVVEASELPVMNAVTVVRRQTSSFGMTTVEEVQRTLSSADTAVDPSDIERILRGEPTVRWSGRWLWMEKDDSLHANRLVNTARSILSVNSPLSVGSIHDGAKRMWKFRKVAVLPPVSAMQGFFEASPYFIVEGDMVRSLEPLDYHVVQGEITAAMIDVLKESPYQVMDRRSLEEACADAGVPAGTFGVWTTYAEWMEKFGHDVWGLRGSSPSAAAVKAIRDAAKARRKAESRRKAWVRDRAGRFVQTMDVTTSFVSSGVMSFVPEIHEMFAGESLTVVHGGEEVGTAKLGANHSFCWGWGRVIRKLGVQPGQVVRLAADVDSRTVELTIGNEELWDASS